MAGIQPCFCQINAQEFTRIVSDTYYHHCYFFEDATLKQVHKANVNLLFSGWGGDDFISGDDCGIDLDLLAGLKWGRYLWRNPFRHPRKFIRGFLSNIVFPFLGLLDRGTTKSFALHARYLRKPFKPSDRGALKNFYAYRSRRGHHLGLLRFYHLQERCETEAVNGFRYGVEYRYPLLDKRIVEYMLKVPSHLLARKEFRRPVLREISQGIVPEEVRWHWQKWDPAHFSFETEMLREAAVVLMEESGQWRANPDLQFIDFDLLEEDIRLFHRHPERTGKAFFRSIVFIKGLHEFCRIYNSYE
jgi:asparagine synthase (glutamine-hydrolysing)